MAASKKSATKSTKKSTRKTTSKKTTTKASTKKTAKASTKKAATKKSTTKSSSKKKAAVKKKATVKKTTTKKAATKKKATPKAAAKSKTVAKKPVAKAKATTKAASKKPAAAKKAEPVKTDDNVIDIKSIKINVDKEDATAKAAEKTEAQERKTPQTSSMSHVLDEILPPEPVSTPVQPSIATTIGIMGIQPYALTEGEEYMGPSQKEHFDKILTLWKQSLMEEVDRIVTHMQDEAANFPDPNDRATQEEEFGLALRARDRERKLIKKIDEALERLKCDEYGFCDTCGIEIGIRRLEARPTATLCIDCKTLDEIRERQNRS